RHARHRAQSESHRSLQTIPFQPGEAERPPNLRDLPRDNHVEQARATVRKIKNFKEKNVGEKNKEHQIRFLFFSPAFFSGGRNDDQGAASESAAFSSARKPPD